jgi:DUF1009 family protein
MAPRIALIAGAGQFPFHIAAAAKRRGVSVLAIGIQGWADPALAKAVDAYEELGIGQLGTLIARLKSQQVREAIMAGKVTKDVLLGARQAFDAEAGRILAGAKDFSVNALLGAIGERLAREGITLLDSSTFLREGLCQAGVATSRAPTEAESADIAVGVAAARALAALDIGQTVVVKGRVVVAVEAIEGTDAAIQRAHALCGGGLVVVKTASPSQDRRFDLPVIGPATIQTLTAAGVSCLAVEAGATLMLDRQALLASADAAGLSIIGVAVPGAA